MRINFSVSYKKKLLDYLEYDSYLKFKVFSLYQSALRIKNSTTCFHIGLQLWIRNDLFQLLFCAYFTKVHIFWEGQKILRNLHLTSYVLPVKSKVKISQNFVAFSKYMNFYVQECCCSNRVECANKAPNFLA